MKNILFIGYRACLPGLKRPVLEAYHTTM